MAVPKLNAACPENTPFASLQTTFIFALSHPATKAPTARTRGVIPKDAADKSVKWDDAGIFKSGYSIGTLWAPVKKGIGRPQPNMITALIRRASRTVCVMRLSFPPHVLVKLHLAYEGGLHYQDRA